MVKFLPVKFMPMHLQQLGEPQFKRYKKGDGYRVDIETPLGPSFFFFHNRKDIPQIRNLDQDNLNLSLPNNIIFHSLSPRVSARAGIDSSIRKRDNEGYGKVQETTALCVCM